MNSTNSAAVAAVVCGTRNAPRLQAECVGAHALFLPDVRRALRLEQETLDADVTCPEHTK
jgi:hypothetical protein